MRRNTDPSFVGIQALKDRHAAQVAAFEEWARAGDWERFHRSHYDWWAFPIDRPSSYGMQWVVYEGDVAELLSDASFVALHRRGIELVSASWGWDVGASAYVPEQAPGQSWHDWPIRLYKAALSAKLFGHDDLFRSLRKFALDLMHQGKSMYYGRDLSPLFLEDNREV